MLKAIKKFQIHQNLLKFWFTLVQLVLDDPVLICAISLETIILNAYHISLFAWLGIPEQA